MQIPSPSGKGKSEQVALRPPWTVMINYEFELRKEAVKRAFRDSRALKDTLAEVQNDAQLKEQFFTSPIALQHRNMPAPNTWYERPGGQPWKWRRNDKGPGKGKGKDAHKGKEQKGKKGKGQGHGELASCTPDGRMICFAYSTSGCPGDCGMVHCCQVRGCFGQHPTWKHWQDHFAKANAKATDSNN